MSTVHVIEITSTNYVHSVEIHQGPKGEKGDPGDLSTAQVQAAVAHVGLTDNPHATTKTQVGLANVDNVQQMPLSYLDTDSAMTADSDSKVPSQKAIKAALASVGGGGGYRKLLIVNNGAAPNTKVDITADVVTLYDSTNKAKQFFAVSLAGIDLGVNGANGLDTGTKANSTEYHLWLIGKADGTVAGLWSLSATAPTMPSGYTYKWRCGGNFTDSSGNIYRVRQVNNVGQYVITAATNTAAYRAIAAGAVGDPTVPTWVASSLSGFIPSTATRIIGIAAAMAPARILMVAPNNGFGAYNGSTPAPVNIGTGGGQYLSVVFSFVLESTNIYVAEYADCIVRCLGWEDAI